MGCPLEFHQSAELIVGYGARTLDPDAAAEFEQHIHFCAACCHAAAVQKAVWAALDDALDDSPELAVSADFDRRLFRRIRAAENRGWWLWRALVPASACLALAALFLFRPPDSTRAPQAPQPTPQIEQVEHALDDLDLLNQIGAAI